MRRDLNQLGGIRHDVLVIGGGIQGACIAWDAALRGLKVALVERDDFGAATSANSLRIVHGGLRYLSRGDLTRMRESIRERSALLRIAPGLVEPLPVLVPTGGPGVPGRAAFGAGLVLTHLLSPTRNRHLDPRRRIAAGRLLSRPECLTALPCPRPRQLERRRTLVRRAHDAPRAPDPGLRRLRRVGRGSGGQPRGGGGIRGLRRHRARSGPGGPAHRSAPRAAGPADRDRSGAVDRDAGRPRRQEPRLRSRHPAACPRPQPGHRTPGGRPRRRSSLELVFRRGPGRIGWALPFPGAAGA